METLKHKVEIMVQHQSKHAKSIEELIRNLLGDTQQMMKKAKVMDSRVSAVEASTSDSYEALSRSCQVFATALKIPSPIPTGTPLSSPRGSWAV